MLDLRLYLVTDRELCGGRPLEKVVEEAVKGGCTMVQLREKDLCTRDFIAQARAIQQVLNGTGVPLLINDRVDVALAIGADGVHLGQSDMSPVDARRLLGPDAIIGLSIEQVEQIYAANQMPIDYVAVSPVFPTRTKLDTCTPLGLIGSRAVVERSVKPVIGIGGINRQTALQAMQCGLKGIAVVSDIMSADCPKQVAQELKTIISQYANI
ncbi:MAG: thiamine phosphate synthase [Paludibacteraceae bacterium]|nr:thiamine phosphate synthase [Paludibacteraceae bacterium]